MPDVMDEVRLLVQSRVPIIWIVTHEENRFITDLIKNLIAPMNIKASVWSLASGMIPITEFKKGSQAKGASTGTNLLSKAIDHIAAADPDKKGNIFVLRDAHAALSVQEVRQLRDYYEQFANQYKCVIITSPVLAHGPGGSKPGLPDTLEKQISVIHYDLPDKSKISAYVSSVITDLKSNGHSTTLKTDYSDHDISEVTRALCGLTMVEIENAVSTCFHGEKKLDIDKLLKSKKQIINRSNILEYVETDIGINDVGGLDLLKEYLNRYAGAWTKEATEFGVEPLKFLIMVGVAGGGKSLTAKAAGHLYKLPLLRLDVGRVFGSLVGASEANMRSVVNTLSAVSPVVCWIDELEKGMAGTKSSGVTDGGTTSRVFGTLLTAMSESLKDVTFVATSNDISALPPELIRRANDVFFVDLPSAAERWDILNIHLKKRKRDIKTFEKDKKTILAASESFTGAEIEKAIIDAIARAYYANDKTVGTRHLLAAFGESKPIATVMAEQIKAMQEWAKGHARYASSKPKQETEVADVSNVVRGSFKD